MQCSRQNIVRLIESGKLKVHGTTWHPVTKHKINLLNYEEVRRVVKEKFL
jgi:hypothetical protein